MCFAVKQFAVIAALCPWIKSKTTKKTAPKHKSEGRQWETTEKCIKVRLLYPLLHLERISLSLCLIAEWGEGEGGSVSESQRYFL